jgi:hypothetical protein
LSRYLSELKTSLKHEKYLRIDPLCSTIGGNICYILTITQHINTYKTWNNEYQKLQKTAAGRRYLKLKELKEENKARILENGKKNEEGKE